MISFILLTTKRFDTHLDEQEKVRILALRSRTVALLDVVLGDIDTLAERA